MKLLKVNKNNINYEFRLLESVRVIEISKGGLFTYLIKWTGRLFYCNCPGSRYHHKCWHVNMVKLLMSQQSIDEPWAEWSEDAGLMVYGGNSERTRY